MLTKIKEADNMANELAGLFGELVNEADDLDLKRLFKQLDADLMDIRHKLSLAAKIMGRNNK
jgi:hypothetical protein